MWRYLLVIALFALFFWANARPIALTFGTPASFIGNYLAPKTTDKKVVVSLAVASEEDLRRLPWALNAIFDQTARVDGVDINVAPELYEQVKSAYKDVASVYRASPTLYDAVLLRIVPTLYRQTSANTLILALALEIYEKDLVARTIDECARGVCVSVNNNAVVALNTSDVDGAAFLRGDFLSLLK